MSVCQCDNRVPTDARAAHCQCDNRNGAETPSHCQCDNRSTVAPTTSTTPFATDFSVPGGSCLYFAYASATASVTLGAQTDTIAQTPVRAAFPPGAAAVIIAAAGLVNNNGLAPDTGPNGLSTTTTNATYSSAALNSSGIAIVTVSRAALIGLWENATRTGTPFFIGAASALEIPDDATALYLGNSDGFGWSNNTGAFTVTLRWV